MTEPKNQPDPLNSPLLQSRALLLLLAIATVLFAAVLWPYSGAVSWAVFLAIVFSSVQERSVLVCRGRKGWAAFGTLLVIVVSVLLPTALLTASITQEAAAFYERFRSGEIQISQYFQRGVDALPAWARSALDRFGFADLGLLQSKLVDLLGRSGQAITSRAFSIGQHTMEFLVSFFVMLYLLFFLLRDGTVLSAAIAKALPLKQEHNRRLLRQFADVVRATVKGNVVVALVQGALGWLAFWFLGIGGALLWGAVMAVLSLLPAVGAALVWGPVALYLLATGSIWAAIGLTVWGVLVIGLVDNVLRPMLVGRDIRMPDYLVLVATLGGLTVFGLNGFVIGPVIAAIFLAAWDIFTQARQEPGAADDRASSADNPAARRRRSPAFRRDR